MFGLLKSGIKLGVGCVVAILLIVALIAGVIWWYFGQSKPSQKPRNARRSSVSSVYDITRPLPQRFI